MNAFQELHASAHRVSTTVSEKAKPADEPHDAVKRRYTRMTAHIEMAMSRVVANAVFETQE